MGCGRGLERVRGWLKSGLKHCLVTLRTCKKPAGVDEFRR